MADISFVEIIALILFLAVCRLGFWPVSKYLANYAANDPSRRPLTKRGFIASVIGLTLVSAAMCYPLVKQGLCPFLYIVASVVIALVFARSAFRRLGSLKELPKYHRYNCVSLTFFCAIMLGLGSLSLCHWFFPDVTTVSKGPDGYEVSSREAWPFYDGLKPACSYLANDSEDSLYRVVVSYAFLGEEVNNHYNVTDTIKPFTTAHIACRPNYVARSIFPVMLPSTGRFGKTRTRRSYIVTKAELEAFETGDFTCFGINDNIRVPSFDITSNPILWEDPEILAALDQCLDNIYRESHPANE